MQLLLPRLPRLPHVQDTDAVAEASPLKMAKRTD